MSFKRPPGTSGGGGGGGGGGAAASFAQPPPPPPPAASAARSSSLHSPGSAGTPSKGRRTVSLSGVGMMLPPPPGQQRRSTHHGVSGSGNATSSSTSSSSFPQNLAKSMTIDEMRQLHARAVGDAEAKRTELRLVLASRYRELVGSSDEVIRMKERAQELHDLVGNLPGLVEKLAALSTATAQAGEGGDEEEEEKKKESEEEEEEARRKRERSETLALRRRLSSLPRLVHRSLDANDVYRGTSDLIDLFSLIADRTDAYGLATVLSGINSRRTRTTAASSTSSSTAADDVLDPALEAQMKMVFLQMQTLPRKISRVAHRNLLKSASSHGGAEASASALAALNLLSLEGGDPGRVANKLLDTYFDSKARLLQSLLNKLATKKRRQEDAAPPSSSAAMADQDDNDQVEADNAEVILSKIVLILQYDIILHPYQVFVLGDFPSEANPCADVVRSLPPFQVEAVRARCSKFLAGHLPLIRTKVKSILVTIAGTTASALGKIRQSLYDKTDGRECIRRLNSHCSWQDAVDAVVDLRVLSGQGGSGGSGGGGNETGVVAAPASTGSAPASRGGAADGGRQQQARFSLWSALFSTTFSSLVHSLLTSAFSSVHTQVVSKLRTSLANAPALGAVLPHEAYRNTLAIATDLNRALLKVSDDAHELLVHAEEREESERRLRQSLYVQTCEIMGRLVCELRRMVGGMAESSRHLNDDATKELIVGRLCYLLKFRLTSLPKLLDPLSSPAAMREHGSNLHAGGLISFIDLQSAFDLADDNGDGLITFDEAMQAVESAFSGTRFRGAEMVRETLLLPGSSSSGGGDRPQDAVGKPASAAGGGESSTPGSAVSNVTLTELTLLTARGLRHERAGQGSALGTVQQALDDIVRSCFREWSFAAITESIQAFQASHSEFKQTASSVTDAEWQRLHNADANNSAPSAAVPSSALPAIHSVSPYVVCHLLDLSSVLNRTTCPSDSLAPVPSLEYATSLGIVATAEQRGKESIPTLADNLRWALLRQSVESVSSILESGQDSVSSTSHPPPSLDGSGGSALAQYLLDVSFLKHCYFERNRYGFGPAGMAEESSPSVTVLNKYLQQPDELLRSKCDRSAVRQVVSAFPEKFKHVFEVSDLSFSSLFGESAAATVSAAGELDLGVGTRSASVALFRAPLPSSRRFVLLPVQADRSLSEIQLRGKYAREKEAAPSSRPFDSGGVGPSVVSSGLGFLSSMLKKN